MNENAEHLPLIYERNIEQWLESRCIPVTRKNIDKDIGKENRGKLLLSNLGLSLTDCYWIKPTHSTLRWNQVSLYKNDFKDDLDLSLRGSLLYRGYTPSASLSGDLQKKWVINRKSGIRYLIKGNSTKGCVQSLSEVLASRIYNEQPYKIEYTPYNTIKLKNNSKTELGCCCPIFTSEKLEFVSAADLVNAVRPDAKVKNGFEIYKDILKKSGIDCDRFYDMQISVDFIITNTDRHYNNFGVLRDPDTLSLIKPAPIYDSGNAMFYNYSYIPVSKRGLLNIRTNSFCSKEVNLLRHITDRNILNLNYLPTGKEIITLMSKDRTLSEKDLMRMKKAYEFKVNYFNEFQKGRVL